MDRSRKTSSDDCLLPLFVSKDVYKDVRRLLRSEELVWLSELDLLASSDGRKGNRVFSRLATVLDLREWNYRSSHFDEKYETRWTRLLKDCRRLLVQCEDVSRSRKAPAGYSGRNAHCIVNIACYVVGHVHGFALAHVKAIDAYSISSSHAPSSGKFRRLVAICTEKDDPLLYSDTFQDLQKTENLAKTNLLTASLLSRNGALFPRNSPDYSSMENVMYCAGLLHGIERYIGLTSSEPPEKIPIETKKRKPSDVEENYRKPDEHRKSRKNIDNASRESSQKDLKHEKASHTERKVEREHKVVPRSLKSACIDLRSYTADFLSKVIGGPANDGNGLSEKIVTLEFVNQLHKRYGEKYADKFRQFPASVSKIAAGDGFAQCFPHSSEIYVRDRLGNRLNLPAIPVLPGDTGYSGGSLQWLGVMECSLDPLTDNDSSADEASQHPR